LIRLPTIAESQRWKKCTASQTIDGLTTGRKTMSLWIVDSPSDVNWEQESLVTNLTMNSLAIQSSSVYTVHTWRGPKELGARGGHPARPPPSGPGLATSPSLVVLLLTTLFSMEGCFQLWRLLMSDSEHDVLCFFARLAPRCPSSPTQHTFTSYLSPNHPPVSNLIHRRF